MKVISIILAVISLALGVFILMSPQDFSVTRYFVELTTIQGQEESTASTIVLVLATLIAGLAVFLLYRDDQSMGILIPCSIWLVVGLVTGGFFAFDSLDRVLPLLGYLDIAALFIISIFCLISAFNSDSVSLISVISMIGIMIVSLCLGIFLSVLILGVIYFIIGITLIGAVIAAMCSSK